MVGAAPCVSYNDPLFHHIERATLRRKKGEAKWKKKDPEGKVKLYDG